jgi:hypothetical protein
VKRKGTTPSSYSLISIAFLKKMGSAHRLDPNLNPSSKKQHHDCHSMIASCAASAQCDAIGVRVGVSAGARVGAGSREGVTAQGVEYSDKTISRCTQSVI